MQSVMEFSTEPVVKEPQKEEEIVEVSDETKASEPISHIDIYPYFDVDKASKSDDEKLRYIYDYFKDEATSKADLLWRIRSIENRIGTPELGVRRYEKVYRYLRLLGDKKEIESEIEAHERAI